MMKILDSQGISWHTISIPTACSRVAWHHRTRQPMDGQKRRGARAEGEHLSYFQDLSGPFDLAANLAPAFFWELGMGQNQKSYPLSHSPPGDDHSRLHLIFQVSAGKVGKVMDFHIVFGMWKCGFTGGNPHFNLFGGWESGLGCICTPSKWGAKALQLSFPITWYYDVLRTWGHWIQKERADDLEWFVAIPGLRMRLKPWNILMEASQKTSCFAGDEFPVDFPFKWRSHRKTIRESGRHLTMLSSEGETSFDAKIGKLWPLKQVIFRRSVTNIRQGLISQT